jgi:hypothetical protein
VRTKFFNLTIVNAYAPTEDKDELLKDQFYYKLEHAYVTTPSNDVNNRRGYEFASWYRGGFSGYHWASQPAPYIE